MTILYHFVDFLSMLKHIEINCVGNTYTHRNTLVIIVAENSHAITISWKILANKLKGQIVLCSFNEFTELNKQWLQIQNA